MSWWQNYWTKLSLKIKHSGLHFECRKAERKVADFCVMIFAAYVIEHMIHLAMAKIRKDNTPGGENEAHSHRILHSTTWEEDQRPPNLCSRTSGKHQKVRECRLMMSHQMRSHLWFLPKVPLWTKFHQAVLGHSKILLLKHPKNFWYWQDGAKCHCMPWGNPTTAAS